jgi:hypothetical protein
MLNYKTNVLYLQHILPLTNTLENAGRKEGFGCSRPRTYKKAEVRTNKISPPNQTNLALTFIMNIGMMDSFFRFQV